MEYIFDYIYRFSLSIIFYFLYKRTQQYNYIRKNILFILLLSNLLSLFNYIINLQFNFIHLLILSYLIKILFNHYKYKNIKSDKLNKINLFIASYKSKNLQMSLKSNPGFPIASACFLYYKDDNFYFLQFRLGKEYMQKIPLDKNKRKKYMEKYVLVNTKYKVSELENNFEEEVLKKRRKTLKGLWRLNCLLSMKDTLNKLKGFEVRFYEFLPCIYINRIINKRK